MASMIAWPIPKVTAICGSANQNGQFVRALADCAPTESLLWTDPLKYQILRSSPTPQAFSLPVRGIREIYTDNNFVSGVSGRLFQFRFDDTVMETGTSGAFAGGTDQLRFRLLYWASPDPINTSLQEVEVRDLNTVVSTVDLHHQARSYWHLGEDPLTTFRDVVPMQINATSQDFPAVVDINNSFRVRLMETSPLTGTNKYFHPAGGMYYHVDESQERVPGFYYGFLADDGWPFSGFSANALPENESDRRFTEDQFVHWLDVTTLDRDQPVVFYWYFAVEWLHYNDAKLYIDAMIDQADSGAQRVGLTDSQHMLVMPHMYKFGSLGNSPAAHAWVQETRDAMLAVATERVNVAFASIYDATDGMLFDGTTEGRDWLLANGFNAFTYGLNTVDLVNGTLAGDLLDAANLHPWSNDSAAFFSAVLGNIIRDAGCPADVVANGNIDVNDLLAVINDWGQLGMGDINQDGLTDIADILLVVSAWGECWPVQAPFNTPAFRANPPRHTLSPNDSLDRNELHSPATAAR